jgi:hypothetical protein
VPGVSEGKSPALPLPLPAVNSKFQCQVHTTAFGSLLLLLPAQLLLLLLLLLLRRPSCHHARTYASLDARTGVTGVSEGTSLNLPLSLLTVTN